MMLCSCQRGISEGIAALWTRLKGNKADDVPYKQCGEILITFR